MTTDKVKSIWLEVNDFNIHCYTAGESGPPIILIHGAGMDSGKLSWKEVIPPLSDHTRLYAVDMPGYGQSEYREGIEYSNDFYVQFIKDFMDKLQLEKAMIIGLSLGGGVAIGFTLRFPEKVTALGIVGSNGISKKWNWHFITYHFYVRSPLNHLSLIMMRRRIFSTFILKIGLIYKPENITNQMIDDIFEETQASDFGKAFKSLQRSEYMGRKGLRSYNGDRMSEIEVPTLIVHGAHDRTIPVANARKAHELIANSELYVMEEARHWPQKEYPEEFTQIVKGFLSKNGL